MWLDELKNILMKLKRENALINETIFSTSLLIQSMWNQTDKVLDWDISRKISLFANGVEISCTVSIWMKRNSYTQLYH
jgi:hypothetical protein